MTSPPSPQPKQWNTLAEGRTLKEGRFSSWKGHRPSSRSLPAGLSATTAPTTSTTDAASRTAFRLASRIFPAADLPATRTPSRLATVRVEGPGWVGIERMSLFGLPRSERVSVVYLPAVQAVFLPAGQWTGPAEPL